MACLTLQFYRVTLIGIFHNTFKGVTRENLTFFHLLSLKAFFTGKAFSIRSYNPKYPSKQREPSEDLQLTSTTMSAVPSKPLLPASDATSRRISVDAYYGVPQAPQPSRPVFAEPSHLPVLSQAQLLQLDPEDRQFLGRLEYILKEEWRCTEHAYSIDRDKLEVGIHNSMVWKASMADYPFRNSWMCTLLYQYLLKTKPDNMRCLESAIVTFAMHRSEQVSIVARKRLRCDSSHCDSTSRLGFDSNGIHMPQTFAILCHFHHTMQ